MSVRATYGLRVENKKFIFEYPELLKQDTELFEGMFMEMTLEEVANTRSREQNRFYWGIVVRLITDELNKQNSLGRQVDSDFAHEMLKYKMLGAKQIMTPMDGEVMTIINSSKKLTVQEFADYITRCMEFGTSYLNIVFPEPLTEEPT